MPNPKIVIALSRLRDIDRFLQALPLPKRKALTSATTLMLRCEFAQRCCHELVTRKHHNEEEFGRRLQALRSALEFMVSKAPSTRIREDWQHILILVQMVYDNYHAVEVPPPRLRAVPHASRTGGLP